MRSITTEDHHEDVILHLRSSPPSHTLYPEITGFIETTLFFVEYSIEGAQAREEDQEDQSYFSTILLRG